MISRELLLKNMNIVLSYAKNKLIVHFNGVLDKDDELLMNMEINEKGEFIK